MNFSGSDRIFSTFLLVALITTIGCTEHTYAEQDNKKILRITVGDPTVLSPIQYQNSSSIAVSRTGVIAAFYPDKDYKLKYRISKNAGETWDPKVFPGHPGMLGNACSIGLREGGVLKNIGLNTKKWPYLPLAGTFMKFNDDFSSYEIFYPTIDIPDVQFTAQEPAPHTWAGPIFDKGKIVQLPNGDLLTPAYGRMTGDIKSRVMLCHSNDLGRSWKYYSTVAYDAVDPNPELPGEFGGYAEPSICLLPNGQMLCIMRPQSSHLPPDYKPLSISWSDDLGRTWTKPQPTTPQLMNIWPTLITLDNGVVACVYGRPGFHVAFSTDNGHTWNETISFSHLHEGFGITGQTDGDKVGPNKLVAIGGVEGGTKVFPVTVELIDDPLSGKFDFAGIVTDMSGNPIADAKVEMSPVRYTDNYIPINEDDSNPITYTSPPGIFFFNEVQRQNAIITVEAQGYAPAFKLVEIKPEAEPVSFRLHEGTVIRGNIIDQYSQPVAGACFFVNDDFNDHKDMKSWHSHTNLTGQFNWIIKGFEPTHADIRLVKYHYMHQIMTLSMDQIKSPIVMHKLPYPAEAPKTSIHRTDSVFAPQLQDAFDSTAWAKSDAITDYWSQSTETAVNIPIKAKLTYDDKFLYVIVKVEPSQDIKLTDKDMIEIYLAMDMDKNRSFQYAHTIAGRIKGRFSWNNPFTEVNISRQDDGGWLLSTKYSWLALGIMETAQLDSIGFGIAHAQSIENKTDQMNDNTLPVVFRYSQLTLK